MRPAYFWQNGNRSSPSWSSTQHKNDDTVDNKY